MSHNNNNSDYFNKALTGYQPCLLENITDVTLVTETDMVSETSVIFSPLTCP
jgi:hypothetical protein